MGASAWMTVVPYEANLDEALWRARRAVFQAGDDEPPYGMSGEEAAQLTDDQVIAAMADFVGVDVTEFDGWENMVATAACPPPQDELDEQITRMLNMTMDAGSHSILDMCKVSSEPGSGNIVPMTDVETQRVLGTTTPSRAQIEQAKNQLWQKCHRGEGLLVVAHDEAGKAREICFLGVSGD